MLRSLISVPALAVLACLVTALCFVMPSGVSAEDEAVEVGVLIEDADAAFKQRNYDTAATLYAQALDQELSREQQIHAGTQVLTCRIRLGQYDAALEAADAHIGRMKGSPWEARAHRLAGNLWLTLPHWGTRSGGEFHRGQWKQGIQLQSWKHDKKMAVAHLEQARDLYAQLDEADRAALDILEQKERDGWHNERLDCLFDLAGAVARFGIYENNGYYWHAWWSQRDDFLAETAGEEDFDEYHNQWEWQRKRPIGLRVDGGGNPIFATCPDAYGAGLGDDEKILFLLHEIRERDTTDNRDYAARSYLRQAMLSRSRFGMDRINSYSRMWRGAHSQQARETLEAINPWELKDDQAVVLAGGSIVTTSLPADWDILALMRQAVKQHPKAAASPEAQYSVGLYYQSRQQYPEAIREYDLLAELYPKSDWLDEAQAHGRLIRAQAITVKHPGVQLPPGAPMRVPDGPGVPAGPTQLQISHRNVDRVWFVARAFDVEGYLGGLRDLSVSDKRSEGERSLQNWHYWVFNADTKYQPHTRKLVEKHIGKEIARWSQAVERDPSHRVTQTIADTPLDQRGAYIITAYPYEPAKDADLDRLPGGPSLSDADEKSKLAAFREGSPSAPPACVMVITDLSLIEKQTERGRLYFVTDARTGAPVAGAKVTAVAYWNEYNQARRKTLYFKQIYDRVTDADGLALIEKVGSERSNHTARVHATVSKPVDDEPNRVAWSQMSYHARYYPSDFRDRNVAYAITDRPVYRPGQEVRYKVWARGMREGNIDNLVSHRVAVRIVDARGNSVLEETKQTDQFGAIDGSFKLGDEPALGVYRIQISDQRTIGGQNFRVEEYKKPEFEVTVTPGSTQAKLGETVTAKIKADYYFGGAVSHGKVSYKVFREEYRHTWYPPGRWDWLYGQGYGLPWYGYDYFPWWGRISRCWAPPGWWWGYSSRTPVRELVRQGEGLLGEDGTLDVSIDTSTALRDHGDLDHRYIIEAEVTDSSRRVIEGSGDVRVTRQSYYAFVQPDRGYYRPGDEIALTVRTLTPDNTPVPVEGVVTVSEVTWGGPDNARIDEKQLDRFKAVTNERGEYTIRVRHEKSGQLKIAFAAPDKWGGTVETITAIWVCGDDFDGRFYRFNNLELITDKRTYQPGETAHVMISTKHPDSYVLLGDEVDNNRLIKWRVLHLDKQSTVVDVPIVKGSAPNFFIEATTVADARVHAQALRIVVPPEDGVLDVDIETDKPEYRPGDRATFTLTAKHPDGTPAPAQIAVSAFDKSVLYIQPEFGPTMAQFFHGNVRHHQLWAITSVTEHFTAVGGMYQPYQHLSHPLPDGWNGIWGPQVDDYRTYGFSELADMGGGGGGGLGRGGAVFNQSMAKSGSRSMAARATGAVAMDAMESPAPASEPEGSDKPGAAGAGGPDYQAADVRTQFADSALWLTTLTTDSDGRATGSFDMPDNLTTWKLSSWAMTKDTRVGQADTQAVTTKNLLVRLQAPRFFVETDEVVISAIVHNYLSKKVDAEVTLDIPDKLMALIKPTQGQPSTPTLGSSVSIDAGGQQRVDWRVKVLKEGTADITVKALTEVESDAMKLSFPVLVHGITKQVATTGSMRPDDDSKTVTVMLDVPDKRNPDLTYFEVQYAPSLVGAMLDALPYLLDYPYGCTEQTMSRFLPAVLTLKTLQNMGMTLEDVQKVRGRMAEIRRIEKGEHVSIYADNPIFDQQYLNDVIDKGLNRIASFQNGDGGWGWWKGNDSSEYLTAYVLYALVSASEADVKVDENMISRGMNYLRNELQNDLPDEHWRVNEGRAFSAYVLSMRKQKAAVKPQGDDKRSGELIERLWIGRDKLNLYGKSLLALTLHNVDDKRDATVLENIMQYKQENAETQVAWFRTPQQGWWYWWNNDVETHAWIIRAMTAIEPKHDATPRVVKWLLNNRRNGYYWRSTRDTTLCVHAMSDFVAATGEGTPDYTLTFNLDDGQVIKQVKINKDNFFTYDSKFVIEGGALAGGKHKLTITKQGKGALYFNTYLRYFTKEDHITAAGHELKVDRRYFRLKQIPFTVDVEGSKGQSLSEQRLRYERVELNNGDRVNSGDLIQVEFKVTSDNDYTFLAFEDMKPAGCEPVDVRSGGKGQEGFYSYMELRDEKVTFFVPDLGRGDHLMRYRLRAEIPGVFHALPTTLFGMYVPELRANSHEHVIEIVD